MKIKAHTEQDLTNPPPMTTRTRMLFADFPITTTIRGANTLPGLISIIRVHGTGAQGTMTPTSLADIRTTWVIRTASMDTALLTTDTGIQVTAGSFPTMASLDIPGSRMAMGR